MTNLIPISTLIFFIITIICIIQKRKTLSLISIVILLVLVFLQHMQMSVYYGYGHNASISAFYKISEELKNGNEKIVEQAIDESLKTTWEDGKNSTYIGHQITDRIKRNKTDK